MRSALVLTLALVGCSSSPSDPGDDTQGDPLPLEQGRYRGTYFVPVTDARLEAAATYAVDSVDWEINGDEITLDYDLPVGLVGGELEIHMTGTLDHPGLARLESEQGTATCTAVGRVITCFEDFADLGVLPISADLINQRAAVEYSGPAIDRLDVANSFASDPIGIVEFDLDTVGSDDAEDEL